MMRRFLAFIFFVCSFNTYGQTLENKHHRVLILLDASLNMNEPTEGYATKYAAASDFIIRLMDSIYHRNDEVEFGLRAYGHQYSASTRQCFDTKLEVQFSRDNIEQMKMRLADIKPRGISNTYTALKEALKYDISSFNNYIYHILIITDGAEACNDEDFCSLHSLFKYKQVANPCIILLDDKNVYKCYNENTQLLTKDNSAMLFSCIAVPIRHTRKLSSEIITTTENKPIPKTIIITQLKQSTYKQLAVTSTSIHNLKSTAIPYAERKKGIGYLKIKGVIGKQIIQLFQEVKGNYIFYQNLEINEKNINQRIAIPEGKYMLVYNNIAIKSSIVSNMIKEIYLRHQQY